MKQRDLFEEPKYTYNHIKIKKVKKPRYNPYKSWHRWVSNKKDHFDPKSLTYSDLSRGL